MSLSIKAKLIHQRRHAHYERHVCLPVFSDRKFSGNNFEAKKYPPMAGIFLFSYGVKR
jgi:hypothetical protein